MTPEIERLREELAQARKEISSLRTKASTTLSGAEFLTLIFLFPLVASFCILGVTIIWKTTSNPAEVAPHLDIILVSFSIFSVPVSGALGAIVGRYADPNKGGKKKEDNED